MRPVREQIAGYIVVCEGIALCLANGAGMPRGGVLMQGDFSTLFESWSRARAAIKRTIKYARSNELPWGLDMYRYHTSPVCRPEVRSRG
jgi:hypothetical protein